MVKIVCVLLVLILYERHLVNIPINKYSSIEKFEKGCFEMRALLSMFTF